ncbi:MAG: hypothetical protein EHM13_05630 [Acidobacteria bacterium]|nr:MAG: hypothetical protein EHM13_05630 [Acidobacteriota bacterium]
MAARYRHLQNASGITTADQLQLREALRARFTLDTRDRFAVRVGASSGSAFVSSWNSTGVGTGDRVWPFQVRHLSLALQPAAGIEVQAGSLEFARGDASEIIGYDSDGYVTGERVGVRRPDRLGLDEIVVTAGYVGDFNQPNFFHRYDRLGEWNYAQALARRSLSAGVSLTGEFEHLDGAQTVRAALQARTTRLRVVDAITLEIYGRSQPSAGGAHLGGQKRLGPVTVRAGLAQIDEKTGQVNSDRFGAGRRAYVHLSGPVYRNLTLQIWAGHALGHSDGLRIRTRVDVIVEYDVLGGIRDATER